MSANIGALKFWFGQELDDIDSNSKISRTTRYVTCTYSNVKWSVLLIFEVLTRPSGGAVAGQNVAIF